ncbi:hypothetical protein G6F22_021108 [Rhizopus arrhizus]|nr:hypothetical protein G6F22_021108 [Rhizopus arrhizus]
MSIEKITNELNVKDLLERIGKEKNWSEKDIKNDISILEKNRIVTVNDLRSLSRESWAVSLEWQGEQDIDWFY